MVRIVLILVIVVAAVAAMLTQGSGQFAVAASGETLPKDVAASVAKLRSLSEGALRLPPGIVPRSRPWIVADGHKAFLDQLAVLNSQVDDDLARKVAEESGAGIERNLIAMARDYSKHPQHLRRLVELYGHQQGERPPTVQAELATDEYRPAWELLLLSPCTEEARFNRQALFRAIGNIRNDGSIPLLMYLYEHANLDVQRRAKYRQQLDAHALDEQLLVLQTLGRFCDSAALHAMLRCVAMSEAVPPPLPKKAGFTMKEWAMRLLRDQENYGNGKQWRVVIEKALQEKEKLSDADRTFLEDVLKVPAGR